MQNFSIFPFLSFLYIQYDQNKIEPNYITIQKKQYFLTSDTLLIQDEWYKSLKYHNTKKEQKNSTSIPLLVIFSSLSLMSLNVFLQRTSVGQSYKFIITPKYMIMQNKNTWHCRTKWSFWSNIPGKFMFNNATNVLIRKGPSTFDLHMF